MQLHYGSRNMRLIVLTSSAIIEDVKHLRGTRSSLVAYYYFDFKDVTKRDARGLLASLLFQLVDDSDSCWDTLYRPFEACRVGSEQPTEATLAQCLKSMIDLSGQVPIYLIIDAGRMSNQYGNSLRSRKGSQPRLGPLPVEPSQPIRLHHQSARARHKCHS